MPSGGFRPALISGGGGSNIVPIPVASAPEATSVDIGWGAVENAVSYEVFHGPSKTGPWTSKGTTTNLTFTITGLAPETTSWAGVKATVVSEVGTVSFTTVEASILTPQSQVQGYSILALSQDWDYFTDGVAIPAQGRTISFVVPNLGAANQVPCDRVSLLIGNLEALAASGMRIAYCLGPQDPYFEQSGADPTQAAFGVAPVLGSNPLTHWVLLPATDTEVPTSTQSIRDPNWVTQTVHETFKWVDLPFGQYLNKFAVYVRIFLPQFVAGQKYASMFRDQSYLTSYLKVIEVQMQAMVNEFAVWRLRQKNGDYVTTPTESSASWDESPDGLLQYEGMHVPTIPVLAFRWGT